MVNTLKRLSVLLLLLVVGCGATGAQLSIERDLKAATSRSTGCPTGELAISQHRPRTQSWKATGCQRTFSCVSIDLKAELAECTSNSVANLP